MKKLISIILIFALVLTLGVCITGCKKEEAAADAAGATDTSQFIGDPSEEYYMVTFVSGIEYWKGCYEGFEHAANQLGVKCHYAGTTEYEITAAVTEFEQVIAKSPAGIAVTVMNADAYVDAIN